MSVDQLTSVRVAERGNTVGAAGEEQGPWYIQTIQPVHLLCRPGVTPAQDEAPFLLKFK